MSFEIITDSSANLPESIIEENNINIVSLSFYVEGKEYYGYEKNKITDLSVFYKMMREKKEITTSLVNIESAKKECKKILDKRNDLIYIGFSSGLSGTYQAVSIALEDLKEEYPNQKIYYVDTLAAALGQGLLVYYAIQMRKDGKSIEETYQWVIDNRLHLCHWFTVDDLFFLKRGGRVSATTAVLGTALSIKPVMHVDNEGYLIVMDKVRGRKKSLEALVEQFDKMAINKENQDIFISHGDCLEDAQFVEQKLREKYKIKNVLINMLDPVIGAHSGPGTVALFFIGNER